MIAGSHHPKENNETSHNRFAVLHSSAAIRTKYQLQALRLSSDEKEKPANAIQLSTKPIVTTYASGHWKFLDEKEESDSVGFSVSNLTCDKPGLYSKDGGCYEEAATVLPVVGFQVIPDRTEYEILSWRPDGLLVEETPSPQYRF